MSKSIRKQIKVHLAEIKEAHREILEKKASIAKAEDNAEKFIVSIYGTLDEATGKRSGHGWDSVVTEEFKSRREQIKNLLEGATNAGLASSFKASEENLKKIAYWYGWAFYAFLVALLVYGYLSTGRMVLSEDTQALAVLNNLFLSTLDKLPVILPAVWFLIVFSKRRSEAFRLQQEYGHKSAIALSYQTFSEQIKDMKLQEPAMKELLMRSAIETIAYNPSATLDKKHGDPPITNEVLEKLLSQIKPEKD